MQTFKNTRSDHLLAAALMIGALVLAVVSWQIPNLFFAPMTADMRGIVETVEPAYENTRMAIRLEGNSTRYTIMLEDYATLTQTPQVGDEVGIKYDITSDRLIRMLEIAENGEDTVVYEDVLHAVESAKAAGCHVTAVYDEDSAHLWEKIKHQADETICF